MQKVVILTFSVLQVFLNCRRIHCVDCAALPVYTTVCLVKIITSQVMLLCLMLHSVKEVCCKLLYDVTASKIVESQCYQIAQVSRGTSDFTMLLCYMWGGIKHVAELSI